MNDIMYQDALIKSKSDSINGLKYDVETCYIKNKTLNDKINNKNTSIWIQGGVNFVLGILTILFAR